MSPFLLLLVLISTALAGVSISEVVENPKDRTFAKDKLSAVLTAIPGVNLLYFIVLGIIAVKRVIRMLFRDYIENFKKL